MHSWDVAPDGKYFKAILHPAVPKQRLFERQAPSLNWTYFPRYAPLIVAKAHDFDADDVSLFTGDKLSDSVVDLIPLLQIRWLSKENY